MFLCLCAFPIFGDIAFSHRKENFVPHYHLLVLPSSNNGSVSKHLHVSSPPSFLLWPVSGQHQSHQEGEELGSDRPHTCICYHFPQKAQAGGRGNDLLPVTVCDFHLHLTFSLHMAKTLHTPTHTCSRARIHGTATRYLLLCRCMAYGITFPCTLSSSYSSTYTLFLHTRPAHCYRSSPASAARAAQAACAVVLLRISSHGA